MTRCVYALTPAGARVAGTGLGRRPLRVVRAGGVAAIVSELPRVPAPSPANLRAHDAVVRAVAARVDALLPARFATCFADADELVAVLTARGDAFRRALRAVRHRVQMTVRVTGVREESWGEPFTLDGARGDAEPRRRGRRAARAPRVRATSDRGGGASGPPAPGAGAAYLRARAEAAARERRVPGFDPVRAAVARWVRGEEVERRGDIASVYHLVPRASADAYRRAVERAAAAVGLHVVVSGPWPPYAFTDRW